MVIEIGTYKFEIWNGDVQEILKLLSDTEVLNHPLGLLAECPINIERGFCINMGHLEVMLQNVHNAFV